ncbi:protein VAC14 homolog [Ostrinia nubilalis]|uniref:protein VAC14 homolog n=1 Tax=Ostrinia nubilalis TaxID=29057 RepID=UPI00308268C0
MSERDYAPLSIACVRGLCDKLYDKRKFAGVEIEKMVKDFSDANNTSQIKRLIRVLGQDLMSSTNPNVKNGALMGLSSVAVGLGKGCVTYLPELTHPIVACLSESESRVRYQAAEALFNVLKIARGAALAHFPPVFDALARLAADPEPQVKQGAELLDRLLKDIVTESPAFDLAAFVPMLRERIYTRNAFARQFIVSWVAVLDAVPDIDLIAHLPELLDGLFNMLDDPNPEIRRMCDVQLSEFLRSIKKDPSRAHFQAMLNILITHAQSPEELVQLTAITWLKEFSELAGGALRAHASGVLCAVLPCLAYTDEPRKSIRETAATVNLQLTKLLVAEPSPAAPGDPAPGDPSATGDHQGDADTALRLDAVVGVLTQLLHHNSVHTKVAALDWILHLYNKMPNEMFPETDAVFVSVVGSLTDAADDVVRRALAVLAEICSCAPEPGQWQSLVHLITALSAVVSVVGSLTDAADDVVRRALAVLAEICSCAPEPGQWQSLVHLITALSAVVSVVGSLTDAADDVVRRALAVLAEICSCAPEPGQWQSLVHLITALSAVVSVVGSLTDAADDVVRRALAVLAEICSCAPEPGQWQSLVHLITALSAVVSVVGSLTDAADDVVRRALAVLAEICSCAPEPGQWQSLVHLITALSAVVSVVGSLTDAADDVVRRALAVLAEICSCAPEPGQWQSLVHLITALSAVVSVVGSLTDAADDVVRRALAVLAEICSCAPEPGQWQSLVHLITALSAVVSVVGSLTDAADDVVRRALAVLAEICSCAPEPGQWQSLVHLITALSAVVSVVGSLTDAADDVVRRALAVLAEICSCAPEPGTRPTTWCGARWPCWPRSAPARRSPVSGSLWCTSLQRCRERGGQPDGRGRRRGAARAGRAGRDLLLRAGARSVAVSGAPHYSAVVSVVGSLTDAADDVVRRALAVLAEICSCAPEPGDLESSPYYYKFLQALLRLLAADDNLLEDRGAFIIRQLCVLLNAEDIYKALSKILRREPNLRFAATLVDVLSSILLTAAELYELRQQLRAMDKPSTRALFAQLYPCWCHSAVSLLALCLLTHNYAHCNTLISTFGDLEITVDFLTEVDKLVQLIESPIFAYLRLELLRGAESAELRSALYGLLMLLPQSDAFHALRARLQCAPPLPLPPLPTLPPPHSHKSDDGGPELDFGALLAEFKRVQAAHREYKALDRSRARLLDAPHS